MKMLTRGFAKFISPLPKLNSKKTSDKNPNASMNIFSRWKIRPSG
jgi:hypothetical protein